MIITYVSLFHSFNLSLSILPIIQLVKRFSVLCSYKAHARTLQISLRSIHERGDIEVAGCAMAWHNCRV